MKKLRKILSAIAVLAAIILASGFLHLQGVCISEARVLSDEEKLRRIIENVNSREIISVDIKKPDESGTPRPYLEAYKQVPYASVDEFLKQNPDCCKFGNYEKLGNTPSSPSTWFSRFMGVYAGEAEINYTARYLDEHGAEKQTPYGGWRTIQNCGLVP